MELAPLSVLFTLMNAVGAQENEIINTPALMVAINTAQDQLTTNLQKVFQHVETQVNQAQNDMINSLERTYKQTSALEKEYLAKQIQIYHCRQAMQTKLDEKYNRAADIVFQTGQSITSTLTPKNEVAIEDLNKKFLTMNKFMKELSQCPNTCEGYILRQNETTIVTYLTGCKPNECRTKTIAKYSGNGQSNVVKQAKEISDANVKEYWEAATNATATMQGVTSQFNGDVVDIFEGVQKCAADAAK